MHTSHVYRCRAAAAAFGLTLLAAAAAHADDTEIFVGQASLPGVQPNILLLFDTSGSMNTPLDLTKAPYNPGRTYSGTCAADSLYWRRGASSPPACNSAQRFPVASNVCDASRAGLSGSSTSAGLWTGRFAQWNAAQKRWQPLDPALSGAVECRNDAGLHGDGSSGRWPTNGDLGPWDVAATNTLDWATTSTYTLYTANWLNWLYAPPESVQSSRLDAAVAAARTLAYSIDGVNLGLMRFSSSAQGGMVTNAVANISSNRDALIADLDRFEADNATPLTETLYEAGQYLAGRAVDYGNRSTGNSQNTFLSVNASRTSPGGGTYKSPIEFQCQRNFVILLTDGEPAEDDDADDRIAALPEFATINPGGCGAAGEGRCLDDMARYLRNRDLRPLDSMPGAQTATTYTVGFGPDVSGSAFLRTVAEAGGGEAFATSNVVDLTNALQQIVTDIAQRSSTFTTASVAVNAFNRTQTTNELYISVFQPSETERWPGNLKKYTLSNGRVVDQFGQDAVDPATGFFNDSARSLWSPAPPDGQEVEAGGALSRLPAPASRKIYTYLPGAATPNLALTAAVNAVSTGNAALSDAVLGTSTTEPTRTQLIDWVRGIDVRDANGNGNRTEQNRFMGDPLHSRPTLVTYGNAATDSIVFVPTNDGLLHAVQADTGVELWSFIPQELLPRLKDLYRDAGIVTRSYGLDGELRVLRFDIDQDGIIEPADGDRVFLYVGMRRGGRSYYALDITTRTSPRMLWRIGADATGPHLMPGMGESWSPPTLARVRVGTGAAQNGEKLVLIFGGGYDATQEDPAFRPDTSGHRVYMVDAVTGNLLWFAGGPNGVGTPDRPLAKMTHSIPARVNVLDLDGDGFADRMYAGDMGGRVWRFDIWNGREASELVTGGVFADLGAASEETPTVESARRFYNAPDVALIQRRGANPYLNLALGSGYRGHPLHNATQDRFYSLRDTLAFGRLTQPDYDGFTAITDGPLPDITGSISSTRIPRDARGWKLELRLNGAGEKVLAEALTVNGAILFPTFQPSPASAANPCAPGVGVNRAYALSVDTGRPVIDWNDNLQFDDSDAWTRLAQTGIAGEISYIFDTRPPPSNPSQPNLPPRDSLGRTALCMVGVEVLRQCVPPGNVVRTFWQRGTTN